MKARFLVVSGQYRKADEGVTLELFGRMKDGRSITVVYSGFRPYFFILEPGPEVEVELEGDPMVLGTRRIKQWYEGSDRDVLRVEIIYPFEVPKYRKRWQERGYTILAADIPFIYRFFYDMDLGAYLEVEGEEMDSEGYTTDLALRAEKVIETEPFKVKLKVLSFDIENSIRTGRIYTIGYSVGWFPLDVDTKEGHLLYTEEEGWGPWECERKMIDDLSKLIREEDPDVITGYNIDGYDIPHLLRRDEALEKKGLQWGRDLSGLEKVGYRSWKVRGRVVVDAWWEAKTTFRPKVETLMAVSQMLLGEGKDDIDTSIIEEEWKRRREDVVAYCEKDANLALRILGRTQSVRRARQLAYVSKLPLYDILTGTTSTMIDSILIREADRKGIAIPLTKHEKKTDKIEGAYVHAIKPGLYPSVIVLDFRSMYPSLMIEHNICFTTFTRSEEGSSHSPIEGVNFLVPGRREGLVPGILKNLMDERQEAKKKRDEAAESSAREYFDGLQEALKVLMNSFYGVFASYFYRFTNRSIGSAITAYAREAVLELMDELNGEGIEVIYSDTDSVFISSPREDLEGAVKLGKELARRYSRDSIVLEFEMVLDPFFTHGKKKRYVGRKVWPERDLIVRGYEMRRTDAFDLQSTSLTDLFERVLDNDIEGALQYARDVVRDTREGKVDNSSLVISRSVKEVEESRIREAYKNPDSMSNVQALRKTIEMGVEVVPGMKVSWIVVDGRSTPQRVEPYLEGKKFDHVPDYNYYAERLASTLARVTEVFDLSEKDLLQSATQTSLFDSFGKDGAMSTRKAGWKAPEGGDRNEKNEDDGSRKTTLDMWM